MSRYRRALTWLGLTGHGLWLPSADRRQVFRSDRPMGTHPGGMRGVFMSAESGSWPDYDSGTTTPHLTLRPDFLHHRTQVRQHLPLNVQARALSHVGGHVDATGTVQVVLVGLSDLNKSDSRWYVGNWPSWYYDDIGRLMGWLERHHDLPRSSAVPFLVNHGLSQCRMTDDEWAGYTGWCGQQHVPYGASADPGDLDIHYLTTPGVFAPVRPAEIPRPMGRLPVKADGRLGRQTVAALQRRVGAFVSGAWGPETTLSLQRFTGVPADAILDELTISALQIAADLPRPEVKWDRELTCAIQTSLNSLRFYARGSQFMPRQDSGPLRVDGSFGPQTILELQAQLGIRRDGAFGPSTRDSLQRRLGVMADARFGPQTVCALQQRVGTRETGIWTSDTTVALQSALNARRLLP